jgi:hypothetical protein
MKNRRPRMTIDIAIRYIVNKACTEIQNERSASMEIRTL